MKKFIFLLLVVFCQDSICEELSYSSSTAKDYLLKSQEIYVVMKIGGNLKYGEYKTYMHNYIDNEEDIINLWKKNHKDNLEKFLILEKIRGEKNVGDEILIENNSHASTTYIKNKYLIFLHKTSARVDYHSFGDCDVFSIKKIPNEIRYNLNEIVNFISSSKMNSCLFKFHYDGD